MSDMGYTDAVGAVETDEDIFVDDAFDYSGYEVVRGEFFAHTFEPSFALSNFKVSVNTACIKKLPDTEYIQILVNPEEKKLAVLPCQEEEKDSFKWCTGGKKRMPRQITCRVFFAKVMELMGWDPTYRYKILGKLIRSGDRLLFIYDLTTPEIFVRTQDKDGKSRISRKPAYSDEWKNQFGVPVAEHQNRIQVSIFNEYAVFGVREGDRKHVSANTEDTGNGTGTDTGAEAGNLHRQEEGKDTDPQADA